MTISIINEYIVYNNHITPNLKLNSIEYTIQPTLKPIILIIAITTNINLLYLFI